MNLIDNLRKRMKDINLDYFVFIDADPHFSEYVNDYYKFRTIISGFTGSNGTLVLGINDAYLFTDGRYFIQAQKELDGSGITLMKMGMKDCPTINEFLNDLSKKNNKIGFFEDSLSYASSLKYPVDYLDKNYSIFVEAYKDTYNKEYDEIKSNNYIEVLDDSISGVCIDKKIEYVRNKLIELDAQYFISSSLDINMWLLNIRGRAIPNNPVALSHLIIGLNSVALFIYDKEFGGLKDYSININSYNDFKDSLSELKNSKIVCDFSNISAGSASILINGNSQLIDSDLSLKLTKAIKNPVEIENIRKYYKKDNRIVTDFINWVKNSDLSDMTEYDLANKLDSMRLSDKDCFDLSFDTISASGSNGAMMHYEATKDNCSLIKQNTLYLVDSGGQWRGATTDITRTIVIGEPTYEMKHDYTRVVRGLLNLSNAVFMEGVTGVNLDVLARLPMWEEGDDYKCGTGHGIGYILSVHEGPNAIRWKTLPTDVPLKPGMIMSCEPGIYKEDKYGIRIENILLVKEKQVTSDGTFLCFECLTYVPLDKDLIIREEMSNKEQKWLDEYLDLCNMQ